jgi:hypothetical protein
MSLSSFTLTDYLAIYGAALSTLVFVWTALKSLPKVKIQIIWGIEEIGEEIVSGTMIFIQNPSSKTIHVSALSILYPWRSGGLKEKLLHIVRHRRWPRHVGWVHTRAANYGIDDGCPTSIEPGQSHQVLIPDEKMEELLEDCRSRKIIASVQDQLWNNTYSKKFSISKITKKDES